MTAVASFFESRAGHHRGVPAGLLLILLLPIALLLRRRQREPAVIFAPEALIEPGSADDFARRRRVLLIPRLLQLTGLTLLVLALARPVERVELPRRAEGLDVILVLDASSSMAATDLDPAGRRTRVEVVRDAASRFVAARPEDRIGIIRFARFADLLCPLTLDHDAVQAFLADFSLVDPEGKEDATAIGAAVARAAGLFKTTPEDDRRRVVVLLTDGEENVASRERPSEIAPFHAAQLAQDFGLRIYAIAAGRAHVGSDGASRPVDVAALQRMAEKTEGRFFRADDAGTVVAVYDEIDRLEKTPLEELRYRINERFLSFLLPGLLLLFVGRLLRSTRLEVLP